ncbi:thiamine pyrophosphate-requiring protein [Arthrobacter sp. MYb213]|uniref:thiamine pyrophosphate-requiring protein n=1 Tax=Arthrobacter sp. MYb213 TaxID=1848595 RepID=UPI000CFBFA7C|nr:thiamine pyrophosphate-requiring protein [Arthrobacter sp. MYb213]PRB72662.1 thiamine pyrophosphate-requiring protein [Arthrobacter sp. MYb213]
MSTQSVADELIARLHTWGVTRLFGYSGDGINPILGALRRSDSGLRFVQARHEENAAFMAVAHSKYGLGQYAIERPEEHHAGVDLGVMLATQGPGAVHLLNGLYDAKLDSMPVLAIVGQQNTTALGSGYQQELNLEALFKDVAVYCEEVVAPEQLRHVVDQAIRSALASSGPAVVIVPHDIQQADAVQPSTTHGQIPSSAVWQAPLVVPRTSELRQAVELIEGAEKIVMLVGQGARTAADEVHAVAQLLDAGIVTSLLGKPYIDQSWPQVAGVMGHLGSTASATLLDSCDLLLIVGSNDPWTEFYPPLGQAKAIQIDVNAQRPGNRYPVDVALLGDAAHTLRALEEHLPAASERRKPWRDFVRSAVAEWRSVAVRRAMTPARPMNPERVVHELSALIPANAQVAVDVGSCVYWYARQLRLPVGVPAHLCSTLASMGASIPYGLAAKLRDPKRPTIVLAGDGAMQMSGNAELVTLSELWKEWEDPRFIICVFNNRDLAEVSWEQRETEGEPRFSPSQDLPGFPFAEYAQMLGLAARSISHPDSIADAWEQALNADRPMLLEMHTDPDIPLLPPFPQGESMLENMRSALTQEGKAGERALQLLQVYADMESGDKDSG